MKLGGDMEHPYGKRIKKYRMESGLTLEEVAKRAGITKGYLWQIEEGETANPTIQTLQQISKALDKTIAELLFGEALVKPADQLDFDPEELPESLKRFIKSQKEQKRPPLTPEDIKVLANIHYRGQRPTTEYDWEMLYNLIKRISG